MTSYSAQRPAPKSNAQQFAQTLSVLAWFQSHPGGSFMRASRDLGLSTAQIQHELKQLSMCGLPGYFPGSLIEIAMDRTTAEAEFTAGLDGTLRLSALEAGVLLLNVETIRESLPADYQAAADSLTRKLSGLVAQRSVADPGEAVGASDAAAAESPEAVPNGAGLAHGAGLADGAESAVDPVRAAIDERRTLSCAYSAVTRDARSHRRLVPDAIRIIDGHQYLLAREISADGSAGEQQKHFRLSRMAKITLGEAGSAPPARVSAADSSDPFGFADAEHWVQFRLRRSALWLLEYFPMWLVDDQGSAADEAPLVTMPDTGSWLERFLIAHSRELAEIEDAYVAQRVRRRAESALAVYGDAPGGVS